MSDRRFGRWWQFAIFDLLLLTTIVAVVMVLCRPVGVKSNKAARRIFTNDDVRNAPIHEAAAAGDLQKIQRILVEDPAAVALKNEYYETPLHIAASENHLEVVTFLLEAGADADAIGMNGFTPLHLAGEPAVFEALLAVKPKLDVRDTSQGQTPLENAAERVADFSESPKWAKERSKWLGIVQMLRDAGANYGIHSAIYLNDIERAGELLAKVPALAKKRRGAQMLPLRRAAGLGRAEIVKLLLEHQADPNALDSGYPVLQAGIRYPAVVKLLLDAGAKANVEITWPGTKTGVWDIGDEASPLHFAANECAVESARLLLDQGVKVDARDSEKQTPLHIAAWRGNAEMVELLLDHGADINAADAWGNTPLRIAGVVGNAAASLLLRRGAKLQKSDMAKPGELPPQRTPRPR